MTDIRISLPRFSEGPGAPAYQMTADRENVAVVPIDGGGATHRIPLPLGTTHLQVQRRQAGDFRAELKCRDKFVNAAHADLAEAIAAAVAKVAA